MKGAAADRPSWLPELAWVLATALLATVVAVVDLELWKMDADVPLFGADGDAGYYLATVKNVVEHGWFWNNPDLGAPFGQDNYDFAAPFGDVAHYVIVAALGLVLGDPVVVFNAFFLVCFPLIAVVAYAVLRDLGAARVAALVAGVLFAFLPYHLLRHQGHLFLTSYYAIPLAVWLVVTLSEGRTLLARGGSRPAPARGRRRRRGRRGRVELLRRAPRDRRRRGRLRRGVPRSRRLRRRRRGRRRRAGQARRARQLGALRRRAPAVLRPAPRGGPARRPDRAIGARRSSRRRS